MGTMRSNTRPIRKRCRPRAKINCHRRAPVGVNFRQQLTANREAH